MFKKCIIMILAAMCCNGQLADFFLPQVTKASRDIIDGLTNVPLINIASKTSGQYLSKTVQAITWGPSMVARALGVGNSLPTLISDNNIGESGQQILGDFDIGLGNEDARLSIAQLIPKYGHPIEKHEVITEDGYILALFRIPSDGPVVFLMHGLLGSADDHILAGPDDGIAYLLANEGYDVWMGNARGNKHSRRHVSLVPSDAIFWDFSWHEVGTFDLPAMIDYTLNKTNKATIKYIGHSQGTTSFFVMASERPEYNSKISLMVALSPVAFMSNVRSPIVRLLSPGASLLHGFSKSIGLYEFLPDNSVMRMMKLLMCGTGPLAEILCSNIILLMAGFGFEQLNFKNLPVLLGHLPAGASAQQFAHYGQGVITGDFRKFDYGSAENLQRYGSETPPSYALENVSAAVSLFYSDADWLAHPIDVDTLYNKLNNTVDIHKIPYEQFNHIDFLWAKDFKVLVYKRLRKLLKLF